MPSDLLTLSRRFRAQLDAQDERALNRLVDAYRLMYDRIEGRVDALLLQIEKEGLTSGKVFRLERYKSLMQQIEDEVSRYASYLRTEIDLSTRASIQSGLNHSRQLTLSLMAEAGIRGEMGNLPVNSIRSMLSFLQEGSPLYDRIGELAGVQAQRVRDALMEGIGLGYGPRETASMIQDAFGMGLTDALRMTRTADLWAYRSAALENYKSSGVVTGWVWSAEKDADVCGACLAEDGSIHDLNETLDGHHNCRCSPIPYIEGLSEEPQRGEAWFNEQSEETQRNLLGPGKYDAYKAGKFEFSQLSRRVEDLVYGTMRSETPLKDLIGE